MKKMNSFRVIFAFTCILFSYTFSSIANPPIKGTITYHEKAVMGDIQLFLFDANYNIVDSTITNANGKFVFKDMDMGDYILGGNLDQLPCGVDLEDAYLIEQHLLGNDTLTPFQLFSADVNEDGAVTWDDYYIITDWWLTHGIPFPAGDWKFEELDIAFYSTADGKDNDTKVTSTGDVDGGGLPDKLAPANIENLPFEQIIAKEGDIIEVPVYIDNNASINGYHLSIDYNAGIFEILDVKTLNNKGKFNAANGTLKVTCLNINNNIIHIERHTAVATLKIRLKGTPQNPEEISFTPSGSPQFLDENGKLLKNIRLSIPEIIVDDESIDIINSYPNPFVTTVNIEYTLPEAGNITIAVFNTSGQKVNSVKKEYQDAGIHQYQFDGSILPAGMYIYRIHYSGNDNKEYLKTITMIKSN